MFCQTCNSPAVAGATFCGNCGGSTFSQQVQTLESTNSAPRRNLAVIIMKSLAIPSAGHLVSAFAWSHMGSIRALESSWASTSHVLDYLVIAAGVLYLVAHIMDFKYARIVRGAWSWSLELTGVVLILASAVVTAVAVHYSSFSYFYSGSNFSKGGSTATYFLQGTGILLFAIAVLLSGLRSRKLNK